MRRSSRCYFGAKERGHHNKLLRAYAVEPARNSARSSRQSVLSCPGHSLPFLILVCSAVNNLRPVVSGGEEEEKGSTPR